MRVRPALLALLVAAATLSVAAPASADHIVVVGAGQCYVGALTTTPVEGGFPDTLRTSNYTVARSGDEVRTRCTFTGLPAQYENTDIGFTWTRVTRLTTLPVNGCSFQTVPGDEFAYVTGEGSVTFTRSGTARVECVFDLGG